MTKGRNVDFKWRYKDYTIEIEIGQLPVTVQQMTGVFALLSHIQERRDTSVLIRLEDEEQADNVPQKIMIAASEKGIYMELSYAMDDWGWDHPLLLAHDHLCEEDAMGVLVAILDSCTDNVDVIQKEFRDISGWVYEEENEQEDGE